MKLCVSKCAHVGKMSLILLTEANCTTSVIPKSMEGQMQVYQKAGVHEYMRMYGKVAQRLLYYMSLAHNYNIYHHTHIIRIQVQKGD